ncbi:acidic fibroblast growth factor binding-domain-containing protein [Syncephalis fuscata]|nr:acidic fibroblast growth factor binding-domain-containing protein [Syncephalis fuscata]
MTTPEFTAVANDLLTIDPTICQCWLTGLSIKEAIQRERRHRPQLSIELLSKQTPWIHGNVAFSAPPGVKRRLIHGYYRLDEPVVRELFGKKLSSRLRRDLEPISSRNRIPMVSCRRQFDNVKRIYKQVEDLEGRPLCAEIEQRFLLPPELAGRYTNILFACIIDLTPANRSESPNTNDEQIHLSELVTDTAGHPLGHSFDTLESFDDRLVQDLRELRGLLMSDRLWIERLSIAATVHGAPKLDTQRNTLAPNHLLGDFRNLLRIIFTIGSNLTNAKEMRNLFITLLEKIVEPCAAYGWSPAELDTFFTALLDGFNDCLATAATTTTTNITTANNNSNNNNSGAMMDVALQNRYCTAFHRLIDGLRICSVRLHRGLVAAHVAGHEA